MPERSDVIRDTPGPAWEKRGNAVWLRCPTCRESFPVAPAMLAPGAPECICPACLKNFRPVATARR